MRYEDENRVISQCEDVNHHIMEYDKKTKKLICHLSYDGEVCETPEKLRDLVDEFHKILKSIKEIGIGYYSCRGERAEECGLD